MHMEVQSRSITVPIGSQMGICVLSCCFIWNVNLFRIISNLDLFRPWCCLGEIVETLGCRCYPVEVDWWGWVLEGDSLSLIRSLVTGNDVRDLTPHSTDTIMFFMHLYSARIFPLKTWDKMNSSAISTYYYSNHRKVGKLKKNFKKSR